MAGTAERLVELAVLADGTGRLAEAALWIAKDEYPDLDVAGWLARLDALAADAGASAPRALPPVERVERLNHFLFVEAGFHGNHEAYEDPRNSFLNDVIERKIGIPISLAVVYQDVARAIGLDVVGVGFPGHFLAKLRGADVLVDPFFGRTISREDCEQRLRATYGPSAELESSMLAPAAPREVLVRMLRNLKHNYVATRDFGRALRSVDRILALAPDEPLELRDRGVLYAELECFAAALADFERYLSLVPGDAAAPEIRTRLPELRRQAARLQ